MGNIFACGDYRELKRSESVRETTTGQKRIRNPEQIPDTMANIAGCCTDTRGPVKLLSYNTIEEPKIQAVDKDTSGKKKPSVSETLPYIAEKCINTIENDTTVSQAMDTKEKSKKQKGIDQETCEREGLEECFKRHETKICKVLETHKKMIESLITIENVNEVEPSERLNETVDHSDKMKLLSYLKKIADIKTKLLDSCKLLEQCSTERFDEISKCIEDSKTEKKELKETDHTEVKPKNDIQNPRKSPDDFEGDNRRKQKELKEKGLVETEAKPTFLQNRKPSDSKPTMKMESYRPGSASATVQFFNVQNGKTMDTIIEKLKTHLGDHLENVQFKNCTSPEDILDNHLLIVPCIIVTRLGEDASHAIKNIPNPGKTALVLIHNKKAHALPQQKSSSTLEDQKFEYLSEIFDLAFMIDNGFYSCGMNSENLDRLCDFCKRTVGERRLIVKSF